MTLFRPIPLLFLWPWMMAVGPQLHALSVDHETLMMRWSTNSGQQYLLETTVDLSDPDSWTLVDGYPRIASGGDFEHGIDLQTPGARFYRVATEPDQLYSLAMPEDGTRYDSYDEFSGPEPDGRRWPGVYGQGHVTLWHDGKLAAYSITIDDNNSPDFPFWLEMSDTYGWKLTWFVIVHPYVWDIYNDQPGNNTSYFGSLAEFQMLHQLGHDIQLHGACASMNTLTAADYEDHILRSIAVLEAGTGTKVLTYAFPCGAASYGEHDYREVITRHMIAARGGSGGGTTSVHLHGFMEIRSAGATIVEDPDGDGVFTPTRLVARYKDKRNFLYSQYRGWVVSLYHGLGGEPSQQVINTFDWLKDHEHEFWVETFTNVAKYAQQRDSATLDITTATPDEIRFTVNDRMDDSIFNYPLTIKIRVDDTWTRAVAIQNSNAMPTEIITHGGDSYLLVEALPDRGEVVVMRQ